eukprot:3732399-Pleurochrysis_carterae.AAC.1
MATTRALRRILAADHVVAECVTPQLIWRRLDLFRKDLSHDEFLDLFLPINPDLVRFRAARFVHYLANCESRKSDEKPKQPIDLPATHMQLHYPVWDRLQSSYDDVNAELAHSSSSVLLIGCDGAGYSRLIHRRSQDPTQFLETTHIVIPQLGEHPHGSFHVLHSGWRLWWPPIERFVILLNNLQVATR